MSKYFDIFMAFFRCGVFGFGGGQATVPLIENEVVDTFSWLTIGEFSDAYAFGNSLPGPITTKLAALVGYKIGGVPGSAVALIGMVIPSAIAIVVLFSLYLRNKDAKWLQGMMKGVRPVVVVMIGQVLYKIAVRAFNFTGANINFSAITIGIALIAAVAIVKYDVHPIFAIVASLAFGGVFL